MPASALTVQNHLQNVLQTTLCVVLDESAAHAGHAGNPDGSGQGTHLRVRMASPLFVHQSRVAQHRLVYDACTLFFTQGLHALAIEVEPFPPGAA